MFSSLGPSLLLHPVQPFARPISTTRLPLLAPAPQQPAVHFINWSVEQGQKRTRQKTSPSQQRVLEEYFAADPRPNAKSRALLSQKLGMSVRSIQIWFQNKKQKKTEPPFFVVNPQEQGLDAVDQQAAMILLKLKHNSLDSSSETEDEQDIDICN